MAHGLLFKILEAVRSDKTGNGVSKRFEALSGWQHHFVPIFLISSTDLCLL
jgi:hypothetical protein